MPGQRSLSQVIDDLVTQLELRLSKQKSLLTTLDSLDSEVAELSDQLMDQMEHQDRDSMRIGDRLVRIVIGPPMVDWRAELVALCGDEVVRRIESATIRPPFIEIHALDKALGPAFSVRESPIPSWRQDIPRTKLLSREEVREKLGLSKASMYRLLLAGILPPPIRFGTLQRWRPETIEGLLVDQHGSSTVAHSTKDQ